MSQTTFIPPPPPPVPAAFRPPPARAPAGKADMTLITGLMIAISYLVLLIFAAIKHQQIANAGGVIAIAAVGFLAGLAVIITGRLLRGAVRHWVQAALGLSVLIMTVSLSWNTITPMALPSGNTQAEMANQYQALMAQVLSGQNRNNADMQRFYQQVQSAGTSLIAFATLVPVEIAVLYGERSGGWACGVILLVAALGCLRARSRYPAGAWARWVLAGVAGAGAVACFVQILVWLSQIGTLSPFILIFHSRDAVLIVYTILACLGVLAIITLEVTGSITTDQVLIGKLAQAAVVLGWVFVGVTLLAYLVHLIIALTTVFDGSIVVNFIFGLIIGFPPLIAAAMLTELGFQGTLVTAAAGVPLAAAAPVPAFAPPAPAPVLPPPVAAAPVAAPAAAVAPADELETRLRRLNEMRSQGLISEQEHQGLRHKILESL